MVGIISFGKAQEAKKKSTQSGTFPFAFFADRLIIGAEMQCDYCENKATVYFTQIIDGVSKKSALCEQCAVEQGVTDPEVFLLDQAEKISPKKNPSFLSPNVPAVKSVTQKSGACPKCGFTFENLQKTGRLGCPQCYDFFRKEIGHNLGGMHKGTKHKGNVPEGMLQDIQLQQKVDQLKASLKEAIAEEDFEQAAALRDELKQISDKAATTP